MAKHSQDQEEGRSSTLLPWLITVLVVLLAGVGGYFGFGAYSEMKARADEAQAEASKARARADQVEKARLELEQKLTSLESERAKLSNERDELSQAVKEKDAELARLKATYEDLADKMKAEIQDGEISLTQDGGRIQVDLVDKILFDSGDASISKRGGEVLARLGAVLAKVEGRAIQVTGHTDNSPPSERLAATYPTNWELSVARAVNVVRFLQEKASVPSERLVAAGYGETRPVASNSTPAGRARNRRIEILLTPEIDAKKTQLAAQPAPEEKKPAGKASVRKASGKSR